MMFEKPQLNLSALSPDELARLLAKTSRRSITEAQVREAAEAGDLLSEDDRINFLEFTAFLAGEVSYGAD